MQIHPQVLVRVRRRARLDELHRVAEDDPVRGDVDARVVHAAVVRRNLPQAERNDRVRLRLVNLSGSDERLQGRVEARDIRRQRLFQAAIASPHPVMNWTGLIASRPLLT